LHIDADSFVVAVDAGPVRGFASHAWAAHRGQDWGDDLVAEGEQGGDGARSQGRDLVAAGSAGFVDELFAPQFAQVVGRLADGVAAVIDTVRACTLAANSATVNPLGAGASARAARSASRMRGLLRSTPPTRVAPSRTRVGSSSRMCSPRNPVSTQSRAVANRSTTPASRVTISGNFLIILPQRNSAVLCGDRLEPKHAFVFGIRVAGQPPEVQLEHGQVKRRCLDHGLDDRGLPAGAGSPRGAEDGADREQRCHK
jgi:hypothetical protein